MAQTEQIFRRKLYARLLEWKKREGATALLIEGARRVGKSTLAAEFGAREYESFILVDFSIAPRAIRKLFEDGEPVDFILMQLQLEYHTALHRRRSLVIFDEVQFCPQARQMIKHLVADGRFDYIETGSLISISRNVRGILIPSEEEAVQMYPMDAEEFRWALGDTDTGELLRAAMRSGQPLGEAAHRAMMRDFRIYMAVGGMPQAVAEYIDTLDIVRVDRVKRDIIRLYEADFHKIDQSGRISRLFDDIPAQLAKHQTRFLPASAIGSVSASVEDAMVSELAASMTVNMCYHTMDPASELAMDYDKDYYKIYVGDTGLFVTLAFNNDGAPDRETYAKLLRDKLPANLGFLYENAVAQMLRAAGRRLFYYTFPAAGRHQYEVDFLIASGSKISPIEVKSSSYQAHASLDAFIAKYSSRIRTPYVVYGKDLRREGGITYLPVYMVPYL